MTAILLTASCSRQHAPRYDLQRPAHSEWKAFGGDWGNTRYSTLDQVNVKNAKDLGAAWMQDLTSLSTDSTAAASSKTSPLVTNGRMFVSAGSTVYAVDAGSGEPLWQTDLNAEGRGFGSVGSEGIGYGDGKIYTGTRSHNIVALDELTGEVVWATFVHEDAAQNTVPISDAPLFADGRVFAGVTGDQGVRGSAVALDATTGTLLWQRFIVPGPEDPAIETWADGNDVKLGNDVGYDKLGGGGIWRSPTADPELGLVYFGTGNPIPDHAGEVRPGDNLYTSSLVAFDMESGEIRWYFQVVHHDLWEGDIAVPTLLFERKYEGKLRKAVAVMRADGHLFVLDRETGVPILPVREAPVPQDDFVRTSPTQPMPVLGHRALPECDEWKKKLPDTLSGFELGCYFTPASPNFPNLLQPLFGVRIAPMSYNPDTELIYVKGFARIVWNRRIVYPYTSTYIVNEVPGVPGYPVVTALDANSGTKVWSKDYATDGGNPLTAAGSGFLTTAGGIVVHNIGDGNIEILDAASGDQLWRFQTGAALAKGSPISYEIEGKQFIAALSGTVLWSFTLDGKVPEADAPYKLQENSIMTGVIDDTDVIETAAPINTWFWSRESAPKLDEMDEYVFVPRRARTVIGKRVTWSNTGTLVHSAEAVDGTWYTGPIQPGGEADVKFDNVGAHIYRCREHPFALAELIIR